ncbi:endonuclease/exonuclease/phosphatase family protein [Ancylobacter oerskovii]|uniref:Endonuclease/exonuclease/phosphatase family protein n=1 Tax=Ancylobacter oerskovii TaxID=459519 RepID=A0ABW4YV77_9HYPH|nr:endonuclease/exonuclease/phosphatase family protein [Ancylobacter oerskovii]MBS7543136.1 endonuclease/exonuclease/phosphatase family protein [Ancylobacter oerskovii]
MSDLIRVMSWNIHGGIGPDRRFDLERIAGLIARHKPDIVALQEIDTRGRDVDCLAPLRGLRAGYFTEARTIVAPDGHYGHALFSRWETSAVELHDLSVRRREPRFAISARIATRSGPLNVVSVHLGLAIGERMDQVRSLARLGGRRPAEPTLMLGDFNDWASFGETRRRLAAVFGWHSRLRTFPARRPLLRLDRLYCNDGLVAVNCFTDAEAARASDHLPVIADIRLAGRGNRDAPPHIVSP